MRSLYVIQGRRRVVVSPMTTNNEQSLFIVWLPVAVNDMAPVLSVMGIEGSGEEQLGWLTWVSAGAGDCARRSRVIMMGACRHPWVVGSRHEHH